MKAAMHQHWYTELGAVSERGTGHQAIRMRRGQFANAAQQSSAESFTVGRNTVSK